MGFLSETRDLSGYMTKAVFDNDDDSLIENDVIEIGKLAAVASDNLKASMDTERTTVSATYTVLKRFVIPKRYIKGSIFRLKFDIKNTNSGTTTWGQVWKNGGAHGTEQSVLGDTAYHTKTEDLAFDGGDLVEIKVKRNGNTAGIENCRIYCDTGGDAAVDGDLGW